MRSKTSAQILCILAIGTLWLTLPMRKVYALAESTDSSGSNAKAVHELGYTGYGVNIGFITGGSIRDTHHAFYDKDGSGNPIGPSHVFNYDFGGSGIVFSSHDTSMAGIIASRGALSNPLDRGAAPDCNMHCARVANDIGNLNFTTLRNGLREIIELQNCRVAITSFALSGTPDGMSDWTLLYDYYAYEYDVVFANPAGNAGTSIAVFGDAYNGITTGGLILNDPANEYDYRRVGSSSGTGLTSDSRRKPDIVAPSQKQTTPTSSSDTAWTTVSGSVGETSWSTPHTAGVGAVLLSAADETASPNDNQNEVIKAVIVNSTFPNINDKSNNQTNPADINNIWHSQRGYGRLDALRAYELLDANQVTPDVNVSAAKGWAYDTLSDGQQDEYTIQAEKDERFIVTLTWDRRVEWVDEKRGIPPRTNGLIDGGELHPYLADLDLVIYRPNDSNEIFSEDLLGLNPNDNLEKCDILLTESGDYTVRVINDSGNGESADYGLAFELLEPMAADFNSPNYIVDYNDLTVVADWWLVQQPGLEADLIEDGIVNFSDFVRFSEYWLLTEPMYYQQP